MGSIIEIARIVDVKFLETIDRIAEDFLKKEDGEKVTVVHHNDADGICSASILKALLENLGLEYELICIEKVYPAIVKKIHENREGIVIYTDLGGLAANIIEKYTKKASFIIDHHPARSIESDKVFILDSELAGISGDIFISASTLNYIFAKRIDPDISNYAYIAVLGAVGDYHDRHGGVLGFDRYVLDEALELGQIKLKFEGTRERYYIKSFEDFADNIAMKLTTLGACGYLEKGYKDGIWVCFNGFNENILSKVERLEQMREEKFKKAIEFLKDGGLQKLKYVQWFNLKDMFDPMGVKAVGEFCQLIKDMTFIDMDKYLIGFQQIPQVIPDIGKIDWRGSKVSGRVPTQLERTILHGKTLGLDYLIPKASEIVGGFADATHKVAAAAVVDLGKEKDFVEAIERLIEDEAVGHS